VRSFLCWSSQLVNWVVSCWDLVTPHHVNSIGETRDAASPARDMQIEEDRCG
jgi:hypothetical protein